MRPSGRPWPLPGGVIPSGSGSCFELINPINHARSPEETDIYKVEPYVVAADVYAVAPHTGRGGWTWYTGSAAWMYRLISRIPPGSNWKWIPCGLRPVSHRLAGMYDPLSV